MKEKQKNAELQGDEQAMSPREHIELDSASSKQVRNNENLQSVENVNIIQENVIQLEEEKRSQHQSDSK